MLNEVRIIGNLGRDVELKDAGSGQVAELSVATSRKWTDKAGEQKEDTQWHRVVVWNRVAESCARYLRKGSKVYVSGRLQTRQWQNKEGRNTWTTEIIADRVLFLDGRGNDNSFPPAGDAPSEETPF